MSNCDSVTGKTAIDKSCEEIEEMLLPYILINEDGPEKILECYIPDDSSKTITIPEQVEIIDQFAFDLEYQLEFFKEDYGETFKYPNNVGTKFIEKIQIPKKVRALEYGVIALSGLENLKTIEVDSDNPYLIGGDTLFNTKNVPHPDFIWCNSQKTGSYTVPSWIRAIGEKAFANSKLDRVILLEKISYISEDAFDNCKNIVIMGYKESYAEKYAKEKGMKFEAIEFVIKGYAGSYAEKYANKNGFAFEAI